MSMEPWKPLSFKEFDALEKEPLERKVERAWRSSCGRCGSSGRTAP